MMITTAPPNSTLPAPERMYEAAVKRDRSFEGVFVIAVKTTGVFCRPGCPARTPRFENLEFFTTPGDALRAGYRPCLRCKPLESSAAPPEWVRGLLAEVERDPARRMRDQDLRNLHIEPARARRYFLARFGMTFHAYCRSRRVGLAMHAVRNGEEVARVGYEHGYESVSGFRDAVTKLFGDPPGRGARKIVLAAMQIDSPLGPLLAVAAEVGLCLLEFIDRRGIERQVQGLRQRMDAVIVPGTNEHLSAVTAQLDEYFAGTRTEFDLPLITPGSDFQRSVWDQLRAIPYGETRSYMDMATSLGRPGAQRAIGRANGDNRIAIVIPCHRVVRADGSLCGYGGGLWRKKRLLELEAARH